jgi:hypothetical protein
MSKRKDMLRDKLNALKPSIPTNTRGEVFKAAESPAGMGEKPAKGEHPASQPKKVKITVLDKESASPRPEPKPEPKEGDGRARREKSFSFDYFFVYPDLMQENIASFNRICDVMIKEANNMNNMCVSSCWKMVEISCDAVRKSCSLFAPFPMGKWPFQF